MMSLIILLAQQVHPDCRPAKALKIKMEEESAELEKLWKAFEWPVGIPIGILVAMVVRRLFT
jgi:hypothetical protein